MSAVLMPSRGVRLNPSIHCRLPRTPTQSPILPRRRRRAARARRYRRPLAPPPAASACPARRSRLGLRAGLGAQPHHLQSRRGVGRRRRRLIDRHQHLRRPFGHADQCRGIAAIHPAVVAECADAHRIRPPGGTRRQRDAHPGQPRSFIRRRRTRRLKHAEQTGVQRHQMAGDLQFGDAMLCCALAGSGLGCGRSANGGCGFGHSGSRFLGHGSPA